MEILNGVYFNNEDFAKLMELARRDDETIGQLRNEVEALEAELKQVKAKLEASITLGTIFMIAASEGGK